MNMIGTTKILTLAFLRPTEDDQFMNRLTAKISKHGICHVELIFDEHNYCHQAFSSYLDEPAGFNERTFSNPHYQTISLSVSPSEYNSCFNFCLDIHKRKYVFDNFGMWTATFRGPCFHKPSSQTGKTFCSKIITEALQHANISDVAHLTSSCTTPSRLYEALRRSQRSVCNPLRWRLENLQIRM